LYREYPLFIYLFIYLFLLFYIRVYHIYVTDLFLFIIVEFKLLIIKCFPIEFTSAISKWSKDDVICGSISNISCLMKYIIIFANYNLYLFIYFFL